MRWVEISIPANPETSEIVSEILMSEGCAGTAAFSTPDAPKDLRLVGYLPVDDRLEKTLQSIKTRISDVSDLGIELPSTEITITWVEDDEWATAWKKYFKPLKIGKIVIKPTWEDYNPLPEDLIIEIDPGMAFGTGNHATTQLCILALQDYVTSGCSVIDAGCGSGILAMSAAKLGASTVLAFDNDPVAVDAAKANVESMGLNNIITVTLGKTPDICPNKTDIVIANIIPNVIIALAQELVNKTKPGGILIVSGIVENRVDDVRNAIEPLGMTFIEDRRLTEWSALVFKCAN